MTFPTIEQLLTIITARRPDLTSDQKNAAALRAMDIFVANQHFAWMNPTLAVKMALFDSAS